MFLKHDLSKNVICVVRGTYAARSAGSSMLLIGECVDIIIRRLAGLLRLCDRICWLAKACNFVHVLSRRRVRETVVDRLLATRNTGKRRTGLLVWKSTGHTMVKSWFVGLQTY